jgi:hypothetical protein
MFCKSIIKKPYMFRSLLYDHPQGVTFVHSAFTIFPLLASSFAFSVCGRMSSMCVCVSGVAVCVLSGRELLTVHDQTATPDTHTHTHTHRRHTATYRKGK